MSSNPQYMTRGYLLATRPEKEQAAIAARSGLFSLLLLLLSSYLTRSTVDTFGVAKV
jgi:hypothetical protein